MDVGHELLQSIKKVEELIHELGFTARYAFIKVSKDNKLNVTKEEADELVELLSESGFVLKTTVRAKFDVTRDMSIPDTGWEICVSHRSTPEDKLLHLKEEMENNQKEIENIQNSLTI